MKYYCKECQRRVKESTCKCGAPIITTLQEEEVRPFIQRLHKKTNDCRHLLSHCLSFVVIGLTIAIIGFLFYYLSFSRENVGGQIEYVVNTACSEFWVSMVALIAGGVLFLVGAVLGIITGRKKRQILFDIENIRATSSLESKTVELIVVTWFKGIKKWIRHQIWLLKHKQPKA